MKVFHSERLEAIASQVGKKGNTINGDSFFIQIYEDYLVCAIADGLGSGLPAYKSSSSVISTVEKFHDDDVDVIMKKCNQSLVHERGAAVAIFKVYFDRQEISYSCVGNIRFYVSSKSGRFFQPLPTPGYLSGRSIMIRTQSYFYDSFSKFLIYTDGLVLGGGKSFLKQPLPIADLATELDSRMRKNVKDDATFIIGTIF